MAWNCRVTGFAPETATVPQPALIPKSADLQKQNEFTCGEKTENEVGKRAEGQYCRKENISMTKHVSNDGESSRSSVAVASLSASRQEPFLSGPVQSAGI
jgi:hypothetical protein